MIRDKSHVREQSVGSVGAGAHEVRNAVGGARNSARDSKVGDPLSGGVALRQRGAALPPPRAAAQDYGALVPVELHPAQGNQQVLDKLFNTLADKVAEPGVFSRPTRDGVLRHLHAGEWGKAAAWMRPDSPEQLMVLACEKLFKQKQIASLGDRMSDSKSRSKSTSRGIISQDVDAKSEGHCRLARFDLVDRKSTVLYGSTRHVAVGQPLGSRCHIVAGSRCQVALEGSVHATDELHRDWQATAAALFAAAFDKVGKLKDPETFLTAEVIKEDGKRNVRRVTGGERLMHLLSSFIEASRTQGPRTLEGGVSVSIVTQYGARPMFITAGRAQVAYGESEAQLRILQADPSSLVGVPRPPAVSIAIPERAAWWALGTAAAEPLLERLDTSHGPVLDVALGRFDALVEGRPPTPVGTQKIEFAQESAEHAKFLAALNSAYSKLQDPPVTPASLTPQDRQQALRLVLQQLIVQDRGTALRDTSQLPSGQKKEAEDTAARALENLQAVIRHMKVHEGVDDGWIEACRQAASREPTSAMTHHGDLALVVSRGAQVKADAPLLSDKVPVIQLKGANLADFANKLSGDSKASEPFKNAVVGGHWNEAAALLPVDSPGFAVAYALATLPESVDNHGGELRTAVLDPASKTFPDESRVPVLQQNFPRHHASVALGTHFNSPGSAAMTVQDGAYLSRYGSVVVDGLEGHMVVEDYGRVRVAQVSTGVFVSHLIDTIGKLHPEGAAAFLQKHHPALLHLLDQAVALARGDTYAAAAFVAVADYPDGTVVFGVGDCTAKMLVGTDDVARCQVRTFNPRAMRTAELVAAAGTGNAETKADAALGVPVSGLGAGYLGKGEFRCETFEAGSVHRIVLGSDGAFNPRKDALIEFTGDDPLSARHARRSLAPSHVMALTPDEACARLKNALVDAASPMRGVTLAQRIGAFKHGGANHQHAYTELSSRQLARGEQERAQALEALQNIPKDIQADAAELVLREHALQIAIAQDQARTLSERLSGAFAEAGVPLPESKAGSTPSLNDRFAGLVAKSLADKNYYPTDQEYAEALGGDDRAKAFVKNHFVLIEQHVLSDRGIRLLVDLHAAVKNFKLHRATDEELATHAAADRRTGADPLGLLDDAVILVRDLSAMRFDMAAVAS